MALKFWTSFKEKIKTINFLNNYRRIYPYVRPYKYRAILALLITIPVGSMDAVIAWVLKPYMDTVMIEKNIQGTSLLFPCLIIGFSFVQSALNFAATYINAWVGGKITMDLKIKMFDKLMINEAKFFDTKNSGDILYRFNKDVEMACSGLLSNLKVFTTRIFSSITLIVVLFLNSWQLSIIALFVLFFALVPLARVRRRLKKAMAQSVASGAQLLTSYNEAFAGNRVVSSYNLYNYQRRRFRKTVGNVFNFHMQITKKTGILSPMMHFIVSIGIAGVIWLGSYLILNNHLTPGGFVSFITALLMLYQPVKSFGNNFTQVQLAFMAMDRVFKQLERTPKIISKPDAIKLEGIKEGISFKHVSFSYISGIPVLNNVSLTIPVGKTYAFVGNSGGGKTTLVNLVPRFYDVKRGRVCIDGIDVRDFELNSLRDKIAIVFQDNFLFAGTIRENILLGREDVSEDRLQEIVKSACLDEFISSLQDGLDTQIGERGMRLSGGQKQRIAIARAFVKDAPIVILDEATSALDNKAEAIVQQAIYNLMADRTVLIVAHRLSTIRNADQIVVIDHGELKEMGTHEELVNRENSVYASLYNAQLN